MGFPNHGGGLACIAKVSIITLAKEAISYLSYLLVPCLAIIVMHHNVMARTSWQFDSPTVRGLPSASCLRVRHGHQRLSMAMECNIMVVENLVPGMLIRCKRTCHFPESRFPAAR